MIERLSPCLDTLYGETTGTEALRELAALGFRRIEFWRGSMGWNVCPPGPRKRR